jgi:hypothetical protein
VVATMAYSASVWFYPRKVSPIIWTPSYGREPCIESAFIGR